MSKTISKKRIENKFYCHCRCSQAGIKKDIPTVNILLKTATLKTLQTNASKDLWVTNT